MKPAPSDIAMIGELTDSEFDAFRSCTRALLSRTFIMRGLEREERLYEFAIRNIRLLELWFSCADMELRRDEGLGVIACRGPHDMRARLGREETAALLVARLLYEEQRGALRLSRFPSVTAGEFIRRFASITALEPKKTRMAETFRRLSFFRLLSLSGDPADPEVTVVLYPSLALALDQEAIEEIESALEREKQGDAGDGDEVIDGGDPSDGAAVGDAEAEDGA